MNLVIDIGNTGTKAALFDGRVLVRKERLGSDEPGAVSKFAGSVPINGAIVSSVGDDPSALLSFLGTTITRVHHLTWRSRYPFAIDYDTPATLGVDRPAAAAGALAHYPGSDILVVDAGSALTIDLVSGGAYRGGSISPGMAMRFRALHEFTGRLPLVKYRGRFSFPGRSTEDAIAGGVVTGIVYEINEYIRTFEEKHPRLVTVITGGDGMMIMSRSDRKMFFYPDLVAEGLNFLLDTNV
ncbi:MAG: type III pantothenate kinase [Bacteroidales bacterium]|nr:type III pantothenate kinase [Bacteroidales bacterium]